MLENPRSSGAEGEPKNASADGVLHLRHRHPGWQWARQQVETAVLL
jgi:hypothetical protein